VDTIQVILSVAPFENFPVPIEVRLRAGAYAPIGTVVFDSVDNPPVGTGMGRKYVMSGCGAAAAVDAMTIENNVTNAWTKVGPFGTAGMFIAKAPQRWC
jgi:hypothetical protein